MKIFVINPGSTSTKIALFEDDKKVWGTNVDHAAEELKKFKEIRDQLPYRMETIMAEVNAAGVSLEGTDAFAARCGGAGCGLPAASDPCRRGKRCGRQRWKRVAGAV